MENPSNKKENKNWLSQLRYLKIRSRSRTNSNKDDTVMYQGEAPLFSADNGTNFSRSNSSIRRSIMKMHNRLKNTFKQRSTITSSYEDNYYECDISTNTAPALPPRNNTISPRNEVGILSKYYWYWGPISRQQAEERLKDSPDGAFLVRDSNSDRYLFSLSFRSVGRIMHTRIDKGTRGFGLARQYGLPNGVGYESVAELIEHAIDVSKNGVFCYTGTPANDHLVPNIPIRLTLPVSRYEKVPTLKYLSRFVIRQYVNINNIEKLPLPNSLIDYLQEGGRYF
nr:unnamed protein product [Callosobruchus analis]